MSEPFYYEYYGSASEAIEAAKEGAYMVRVLEPDAAAVANALPTFVRMPTLVTDDGIASVGFFEPQRSETIAKMMDDKEHVTTRNERRYLRRQFGPQFRDVLGPEGRTKDRGCT